MPFWRSMFRRKRRKAVVRNFQAARHDAMKLKALRERAPQGVPPLGGEQPVG
jgi:hypothetical protein